MRPRSFNGLLLLFVFCFPVLVFPASIPGKYRQKVASLQEQYQLQRRDPLILVDTAEQLLLLIRNDRLVKRYRISTSRYGLGSENGSFKTPTGSHRIQEKIGKGASFGTIFKFRVNTGDIAQIPSDNNAEDYVTSRIMHLIGLEVGHNRGEGVDSYRRCIYIHGTPDEKRIGQPTSRGCIRMKNKDVISLFKRVGEGTLVEILGE